MKASLRDVCIIDDEVDITDMCADFFDSDYNVVVFNNPKEALEKFKEGYRPALIVSDMKMPSLSGLDLAEELKKMDSKVPIVMMSGYANKGHVLEALEKRVSHFIEKPFDPNKLLEIVAKIFQELERVKSLEALNQHYEQLLVRLSDLKDEYHQRFVHAENRVFDLGGKIFENPEEIRKYFMTIKDQERLEKLVEELSNKVLVIEGGSRASLVSPEKKQIS